MRRKGENEDTRMIRVPQVLATKSCEKLREKPQNHSNLRKREKRNRGMKNGLGERIVRTVTVSTSALIAVITEGRKRKEKIRVGKKRRGEKKKNGRRNVRRKKKVNNAGRETMRRLLSRALRKILPQTMIEHKVCAAFIKLHV